MLGSASATTQGSGAMPRPAPTAAIRLVTVLQRVAGALPPAWSNIQRKPGIISRPASPWIRSWSASSSSFAGAPLRAA